MQFLPDSADLLHAIADLLDGEILPAVPEELRHRVRVAANLARLIEREVRLGQSAAVAERDLLAELLGPDVGEDAATLATLLAVTDDVELERRAWEVMVEITRRDLDISKPGYDAWEGN